MIALLSGNSNTEETDEFKQTPLMVAGSKGDYAVVELLLPASANIEAIDLNQKTPLMIAAANGQLSIVKLLLDHT